MRRVLRKVSLRMTHRRQYVAGRPYGWTPKGPKHKA